MNEFKNAVEYLNQALGPAAYLVGHSVSIADFAIWAVLRGNALQYVLTYDVQFMLLLQQCAC